MRPAASRSPRGAIAIGVAATVVGGLPGFVTGVMVVQLTRDLGFGVAGLGLAMSFYYGVGAALSVHLGRLVDILGAARSLRLAGAGTAVAVWGIAATADRLSVLIAWLSLAGAAHMLGQPAANRLLVNRVGAARLGTAFGVKQSAPGVASMLAGLSVPAIALTVGWRWTYVLCGVLAVIVVVSVGKPMVRPPGRQERGPRPPLRDRSTIVLLTFAFAFAFGANAITLAFYVDSAVVAGATQSVAGTVFAVASVAAIVTRLVAGVICDRTRVVPLRLAASLLAGGSVGLVMLATGRPTLMVVGIVIALGLTWGFPGVFWLALIRAYPDQPGRITGALQPGGFGAMLAPLVFGLIVEAVGYGPGWLFTAGTSVVAATIMFVAAGRLTGPDPAG